MQESYSLVIHHQNKDDLFSEHISMFKLDIFNDCTIQVRKPLKVMNVYGVENKRN